MIEKLRLKLRKWLATRDSEPMDYATPRFVTDHIEDLRTEFSSRMDELEKSYANGSIKQNKEEQSEPIVSGRLPLSVRKRQWEAEHRKQPKTAADQRQK